MADTHDDEQPRKVTVHRVQPGQRVKIGPQGWSVAPPPHTVIKELDATDDAAAPSSRAAPTPAAASEPSEPAAASESERHAVASSAGVTGPVGVAAGQKRARKVMSEEELCRNGQAGDGYFWTQSKDEIVVSVPVPKGTRAKQIKVVIEEQAVFGELDGRILIQGSTQHGIDTENDDTDWELVDWEPEGRRLLQITIRKKIPHELNFALWWSKFLVLEEKEVDVEKVPGREEKVKSFKQVWQEAHKSFLSTMQDRQDAETIDV